MSHWLTLPAQSCLRWRQKLDSGLPEWVVPMVKDAGLTIISLVGTVRAAKKVERLGADVVVAQGYDAGGHTGRVGTLSLVPQVVDAVGVPVVAAGGIADGRGLVAALAFGAVGVMRGTRFIATPEADAHSNYKQAIVEANEEGTTITRAYSGKTARHLKNRYTELWQDREHEALPMPH